MKVINIIPITQTSPSDNGLYFDGRPCFNPEGNTVLFERNGNGISRNQLWTVDINTNSENLYYKSDTYGCLRASWSWNPKQKSNQIAFTGIFPKGHLPTSRIMLLDENGMNNSATHLIVPGYEKAQLSYPAWYANEMTLLITDYSNNDPKLLKFDINSAQSEKLTYPDFWSGMGTVNPVVSTLIAYAGQRVKSKGYYQKKNKVYIQNGYSEPIVFSNPADDVDGRTPWFSNDGRILAFESKTEQTNLQIFLKKVDLTNPNTPIIHVDGPSLAAAHPKFSRDGSLIVWAQNNEQGGSQIYMGTIIDNDD
ncbi:MAG: hypothetical protein AB8B65_16915 [Kordia sp.]|uniref:hypothetical protein n=1 Tax=Kordia sp. TaxID=1965332 RepID=UPI0038586F2C